jgi:Fe-S cluster assembly scaffold protein SufB
MVSSRVILAAASAAVFSSAAAYEQMRTNLSACKQNPKVMSLSGALLTTFQGAQDYFDYTMSVGDSRYDASYNYVWYNDNGPWSTRFTAWYIPGLLHRNQGDDVANAQKALRNL